jgi:hypothetical protein
VYIWLKPKKRGGASDLDIIINDDKHPVTGEYNIKFNTLIALKNEGIFIVDINNEYITLIKNIDDKKSFDQNLQSLKNAYNDGIDGFFLDNRMQAYGDDPEGTLKYLYAIDIIFIHVNQVIINFYDNDVAYNNFYKAFLIKWKDIISIAVQNLDPSYNDYKILHLISNYNTIHNNINIFGAFGFIPNQDMIEMNYWLNHDFEIQTKIDENNTAINDVNAKITTSDTLIIQLSDEKDALTILKQNAETAYQREIVDSANTLQAALLALDTAVTDETRELTNATDAVTMKEAEMVTKQNDKQNLDNMLIIAPNMFMESNGTRRTTALTSAETALLNFAKDKYAANGANLNFVEHMYDYDNNGNTDTGHDKITIVADVIVDLTAKNAAIDIDITNLASALEILKQTVADKTLLKTAAENNKRTQTPVVQKAHDDAIAAKLEIFETAKKADGDKNNDLMKEQQKNVTLLAEKQQLEDDNTSLTADKKNVDVNAIIDAYITNMPNVYGIVEKNHKYIQNYDMAFLNEDNIYKKYIITYSLDNTTTSYKYYYTKESKDENVKSMSGTSFNLDKNIIIENVVETAKISINILNNILTGTTSDKLDIIDKFLDNNMKILFAPTQLNYVNYIKNIKTLDSTDMSEIIMEDLRHFKILLTNNKDEILGNPKVPMPIKDINYTVNVDGDDKNIILKRTLNKIKDMLSFLAKIDYNIFIQNYINIISYTFNLIFTNKFINYKSINKKFKDIILNSIKNYFQITVNNKYKIQLKSILENGWWFAEAKITIDAQDIETNYELDSLCDILQPVDVYKAIDEHLIPFIKKLIDNLDPVKKQIDSLNDKELSKYFYSIYFDYSMGLFENLKFDVYHFSGREADDVQFAEAINKLNELYDLAKENHEKAKKLAKELADADEIKYKDDNAVMSSKTSKIIQDKFQEYSTDCMIVPDDSKQITFISSEIPYVNDDDKMQKNTGPVRESVREAVWDKIEKISNDESYKNISNVFVTWDNASLGQDFTIYANSHSLDLSKTIYVMEIVDQGKGNKEVLDAQMHVDIANALQKTTEQALKIPVLASDEKTVKERKSEISKKRACRIYKLLPNGTKEIIAWVNTENIRL